MTKRKSDNETDEAANLNYGNAQHSGIFDGTDAIIASFFGLRIAQTSVD